MRSYFIVICLVKINQFTNPRVLEVSSKTKQTQNRQLFLTSEQITSSKKMSNYYGYGSGNQGNDGFYGGGGGQPGGGFFGQQQQQEPQQQPGTGFFGSTNTQQWQQPQGGGDQQQQQAPQQQQSQQTGTGFFANANPSQPWAAVANNEAMIGLATTAGKNFIESGMVKMVPGLENAMLTLRTYFAVDNKYVLKKALKILFPFRTKHWKRQVSLTSCFVRVVEEALEHGIGSASIWKLNNQFLY